MGSNPKPTPFPGRLPRRCVLAMVLAVGAVAVIAPVAASSTLKVKDTGHLKLTGSHENTLIETGRATGTVPGTLKLSLTLRGFKGTSSFTIYANGGSISGVASGEIKNGKGGYESFGGNLKVTGGTGRYHNASGSGGLYGTIDRANTSITVQVKGQFHP